MSIQYSVTLYRHDDEASIEIVDRYITADETIALMLHINEHIVGPEEESEEETVEEEQEEEPEVAEEEEPTASPKKAKAPKKAGKALSYDKDAIVADLKAGKAVADIAEEHKVTKQTVYNVKHRFLSEDEDSEPEAIKLPEGFGGETAYAKRQRERAQQEPEEKDIDQEIRMMVAQGLSVSELEMMFPSVELTKINSIYRELRPIS